MKKVSIYSLLFALLIALSPLSIKADISRALSSLGIISLGFASYVSFEYCFENFKNSLTNGDHAEQNWPSRSASEKESVRKIFIANKKTAQNYGKIFLISGMASLLGAGYLIYKKSV